MIHNNKMTAVEKIIHRVAIWLLFHCREQRLLLYSGVTSLFIFSAPFVTLAQTDSGSFEIYAHRGFRGLNVENTVRAMKEALTYGAILEMDLGITKDKQVVVTHDPVLNPTLTLNPNGEALEKSSKQPVFQLDYKTLRTYDIGSLPHPSFPQQNLYPSHIPLFKELVDSVEAFAAAQGMEQPIYFVETKLKPETDRVYHPEPEVFVDLMMEVVETTGIRERLIVQSFDPRTLQVLKRKHSDIKLAFLAKAGTSLDENLKWLGFTPDYYSINAGYIDYELVEQCQKRNIRLIIGNCNDYREMERIAKLGVNRVISDYPFEWLSTGKHINKE